jgi:hypothetical protein
MKKVSAKKTLVTLLCLSGITILTIISSRTGAQSQNDVVLNYNIAKKEAQDEKRKEKNKRFNSTESSNTRKITQELPEGAENLPTIVHWWIGLPALPINETEATIIGTVTDRAAYLSEDETNIYTEYEFKVEDTLKDSTKSLNSGGTIALVRNGGSIRFESGKIQKNEISKQGTLDNDTRYLLFLKRDNGVDWFIVTGYEFSGEKAVPIDGQENQDPKSALPFNKYLNTNKDSLLLKIQEALQENRTKGGI